MVSMLQGGRMVLVVRRLLADTGLGETEALIKAPVRRHRKAPTDGLDTISVDFRRFPLMTIIYPFGFRNLCWIPLDSVESFEHVQNSQRSLPEWSLPSNSVVFPLCAV